jgi:hypothetical protein
MFSNFLLGFSSKHREDRPLWDAVYDQFLLQPKRCLSCPAQMSFSLSLSLCAWRCSHVHWCLL